LVTLFLKKRKGTYITDRREFSTRLRRVLGFKPGNLMIYEMAFIHRSASFYLPDGQRINNERLEYLGDAVLDTVLSDFLFERYPEADEGTMTKIRSRLVNREILNLTARKMGLHKLLVTQISNQKSTRHLYGDALEALTGAVFIDKGYKKTRKFIIGKVLKEFVDLEKIIETDSDYKSLLFEWAQKTKTSVVFSYKEEYDFNRKMSMFSTSLMVNNNPMGNGNGSSKKEAEQEACHQAWNIIVNKADD
jgi:ribonuclease III